MRVDVPGVRPSPPVPSDVTPSFLVASLAAWRAANGPAVCARDESHPALVKLSIRAKEGARTGATLGAEREGSGVVIDGDGLVLTIGYLILEAASILVIGPGGQTYPGTVVGFDHATGFGLVRTHRALAAHPLPLGDSDALHPLDTATIATQASAGEPWGAAVAARRRFVGYWEYMIDSAIFTAPPRSDHSGAALIDGRGELAGIGSLWVNDVLEDDVAFPGNMFVPVNILKPILPDLIEHGRRQGPARPWVGMYTLDHEGHVVVTQVLPGSPAERAGLNRGDLILSVGDEPLGSQEEFYRRLWASGEPGTVVTLHVMQHKKVFKVPIRTGDRLEYLKPWTVR
jgi:S1-C subfamily serine protease